MKLEQTFTIDAPLEKVMKAMRDPALIEEDAKSRTCVSMKIVETKNTADAHHFEMHTVDYAVGLTGIDKKKTENNTNYVEWDLKKGVSTWKWKGGSEMANKAKITGGTNLSAQGKGTSIYMYVDIDVPIPIVGKKVSEMIGKNFKSEWPKYMERLTKWVKK